MLDPHSMVLPLLDQPPRERSDAARNREALLAAAARLVEQLRRRRVTMDSVAAEAGVGKGTVFRRFDSREGLMAALLNRSETEWQRLVIEGPPPLGPGAPPLDRLLAFGHSRMELNLAARRADPGGRPGRSCGPTPAVSFAAMHVRYLLTELGVRGDIAFLATALLAPLEMVILVQQTRDGGDPAHRASSTAGTTWCAGWSRAGRCSGRTLHPTGSSPAGRVPVVPRRGGLDLGARARSAAPPRRGGRPASRRRGGRPASSAAAARRPACR